MKGMVLAAGYGTRLAPLTDLLPKPMFPVGNMPLVDFALMRLAGMGITEVMANLHHLPDPIRDHLVDGSKFGQNVNFSEEPAILGTGGGIKAIREWVGDSTLAVTNGDTILLSPLDIIADAHKDSGALATLALVRVRSPGRFSSVSVDDDMNIVDIGDMLEAKGEHEIGVFVGVHLLEPEIFDYMPAKDHFCIIRDVYLPLIEKEPGRIKAHWVSGEFFDMGTPEDYLQGNLAMLMNHLDESSLLVKGLRHLGDNIFVGDHLTLARGVNLKGPCIIGSEVRIDGGSEIGPGSVVGAKAWLGPWTRFYGSVAWPGALLPGGGLQTRTIVYGRQSYQVPELND